MADNLSYYIKGREGVHLIALLYPTANLQRNPFTLCLFVEIEWLFQTCFVTFMVKVQRERVSGCLWVRSSKIFTDN